MTKRNRRKHPQLQVAAVGLEVAQVFFGVGTVPLSDAVIAKLVARGWPRVDLEQLKRLGAVYSLQRDSIVIPDGLLAA
jgi:hypothetical protein